LSDGVQYATTDHGLPSVEDRWAGSSDGATSLVADAINLAQQRDTSRLGRLVAPMAVRYFVVLSQRAPGGSDLRPFPADVERALAEQLDLEEVLSDPGVHVYRNVSWAPMRTELSKEAAAASQQSPFFDAAATVDLAGSPPLLIDSTGYAHAEGHVNGDTTMYLSAASSDRWSLTVDGHNAPRSKAFGNGMLGFDTPLSRYGLLIIQAALWAAAIWALRVWRRQERAPAAADTKVADTHEVDG
jgi:hypothetical protein